MLIYLGSDHAGYELREHLAAFLRSKGHETVSLGAVSADEAFSYVPAGASVAEAVIADPGSFGIVVCGTGIGISISANKVEGARAALCTNEYMARMAREHNNSNILALGARVVGIRLAESITDAFFEGQFEAGGRHEARVEEISRLDHERHFTRSG